jgi:hypothetical protein
MASKTIVPCLEQKIEVISRKDQGHSSRKSGGKFKCSRTQVNGIL